MSSRGRRDLVTKPKCNPILGELPVLQYCAIEQLTVDESYQRSLEATNSVTLIRRIAMYWDWGLCQPLYVSRRIDGKLYVVDGQHRLGAARLRGDIWQLPCVVRAFESAEQEAAAFVALNQERRPLSKLQIFKAAIAAGDFEAAQIVASVEAAGLSIASTTNLETCPPGALSNIGGLQNCYRVYGVQVLDATLALIATAYPGQALRYAGTIFPGIVALVAGEIEARAADPRLDAIGALVAQRSQIDWVRAVQTIIAEHPSITRKAAATAAFTTAWHEFSPSEPKPLQQPRVEKPHRTLEEQIALVESGKARVIPAFHPHAANPDRTLGGVSPEII